MKKLFIYIFALATSMGFTSCLDDDNDYNYSEEVLLTNEGITGMKDEYSLAFKQKLTITPTYEFKTPKGEQDVSFEWRLDDQLLPDEKGASCSFSFDRGGEHTVTFSLVHNQTGVKFSRTVLLRVRSPFSRGWLVLSEGDNQESVLNFVGASTILGKIQVTDGETFKEEDRDSLDYNIMIENISEGLGHQPKGLFLNAGFLGSYGDLNEIPDEVGVMQDRWVELNGNTLERTVYTEDEFRGDLPAAGFLPQAAAMTYSAKALLNGDGHVYWATMANASDYHSCAYANFPLGKNKKFKGLYPSYKLNKFHGAMPAVTEDNELLAIIDNAETKYGSSELKISQWSSGIYSIQDGPYEESPADPRYQLGNAEVITILPATTGENGYQDDRPSWVAILKEGANYELFFFTWEVGAYRWASRVSTNDYRRLPLQGLKGFTDVAVFNTKQYAIIADGNKLYYFQYGAKEQATLKELHTFNSPVKALGANDISVRYTGDFKQPGHNGQLGVALEDGTFTIFEVIETSQMVDELKLTTDVKLGQVFPDPKATEPLKNNFGKIVDIIYKYGSLKEFVRFKY